ncbi:MAG: hypothetical protein V1934_07170 [Methanobacteriota archaeon]
MTDLRFYIENTIYISSALVSAIFAFGTIYLLQDRQIAGGFLFLKAKEVGILFSVLFWGLGVSAVIAAGFYVLYHVHQSVILDYIVTAFITAGFICMSYVVVRLYFIVRGD